jgi:hypothetical protein
LIIFCYHIVSHIIIKNLAFSFKMNEHTGMINNYYNKALIGLTSIFKEEYLVVALVVAINSAFIMFCAFISFISIIFISNFFYILWNLLTPGQKLLEFTSIIASFTTLTILFKAGNEFEKNIDEAFAKLKKEITCKNDIILEKDEKIAKLELIINELNKKCEEPQTIIDE